VHDGTSAELAFRIAYARELQRKAIMKPFTSITVLILVLFGLVHVMRLIVGWPVIVNGVTVPMWVSVVAPIVAWALAALVWRERGP
jgi:hypothetical protein